MSIEIHSIIFEQSEVADMVAFDMSTALKANNMWLVFEGFSFGYIPVDTAIDRLHVILHQNLAARIN